MMSADDLGGFCGILWETSILEADDFLGAYNKRRTSKKFLRNVSLV